MVRRCHHHHPAGALSAHAPRPTKGAEPRGEARGGSCEMRCDEAGRQAGDIAGAALGNGRPCGAGGCRQMQAGGRQRLRAAATALAGRGGRAGARGERADAADAADAAGVADDARGARLVLTPAHCGRTPARC